VPKTPIHISVIIPTYNRANFLERAIDSVLSQTRKVDECIIVDDGSSDNSSLILQKYQSNVGVIRLDKNSGVSHARNVGMKMASGNWIALLDSDDEWKANKLERQLEAIHKKPDTVFCHTEEIWIRNGKRVNQMKKHQKFGGFIFDKSLERCLISPSSVLFQKSLLGEIGYFDPTFPICEDYDLWLKVSARYAVLFLDEPLVIKYAGHKDQLSLNTSKIEQYRIKALENLVLEQGLKIEDEFSALEMLIKKCHIYLSGSEKRGHQNQIQDFRLKIKKYKKRLHEVKVIMKDFS
jgi:glycosyltransferase involved in cell wall biosynthesis